MKKLFAVILAAWALFVFAACGKGNGDAKTVATVEKAETRVVITVEEVDGEPTLYDVMVALQEDGKLTFTMSADGMISSIEGKENPADWSACWMLYTSDGELSNNDWGTVEYNGQNYGSAIVGATDLPVIAGGVYVWDYQTF